MAKPVNDITGDAPDGQNPYKKYVPEKEGRFKYTPPPPPKPDPRDAEIFTEEKLRRSGGKMKEPPMGLDSKKRGGVIKRRFASGGEIMDEYDGAIGRGTDTPDRKIAREKSDAAYESDAGDKAAGLKASKDEPVGFFKRLMMGNIDKPGSEAYEKFGAGRGRGANIPAAAERQAIKRKPDEGFEPPVRSPSPRINIDDIGREEKNREKFSDFGNAEPRGETVSPSVTKRPVGLASMLPPAKDKGLSSKKETKGITKSFNLPNKKEEDETVASPVVSTMSERYKIPGDYKEVRRVNALRRRMGMTADDETEEELRKEEFRKKTGMASGGNVKKYAKGGPIDKETVVYPRDTGKETVLEDNPDLMKRGRGLRGVTGEIANLDSTAVRDRKTAQMLIAQDEKLEKSRRPQESPQERNPNSRGDYKRGGNIKAYASGGSVSASSRGDGCAQRGKTRGMMR